VTRRDMFAQLLVGAAASEHQPGLVEESYPYAGTVPGHEKPCETCQQ